MVHSNTSSTSTQLFTDLTAEEGAAVSGGANYILRNRSSAFFYPQFNGQNYEVPPLGEITISSGAPQAIIAYDQQIGPGYELNAQVVTPGVTTIDETPDRQFLVFPPQVAGVPGGPIAAAVAGPIL